MQTAYSLDLDPVWKNYIVIELTVVTCGHMSFIQMSCLVRIVYCFCSILWHSAKESLPCPLMDLRTIWKSSLLSTSFRYKLMDAFSLEKAMTVGRQFEMIQFIQTFMSIFIWYIRMTLFWLILASKADYLKKKSATNATINIKAILWNSRLPTIVTFSF